MMSYTVTLGPRARPAFLPSSSTDRENQACTSKVAKPREVWSGSHKPPPRAEAGRTHGFLGLPRLRHLLWEPLRSARMESFPVSWPWVTGSTAGRVKRAGWGRPCPCHLCVSVPTLQGAVRLVYSPPWAPRGLKEKPRGAQLRATHLSLNDE